MHGCASSNANRRASHGSSPRLSGWVPQQVVRCVEYCITGGTPCCSSCWVVVASKWCPSICAPSCCKPHQSFRQPCQQDYSWRGNEPGMRGRPAARMGAAQPRRATALSLHPATPPQAASLLHSNAIYNSASRYVGKVQCRFGCRTMPVSEPWAGPGSGGDRGGGRHAPRQLQHPGQVPELHAAVVTPSPARAGMRPGAGRSLLSSKERGPRHTCVASWAAATHTVAHTHLVRLQLSLIARWSHKQSPWAAACWQRPLCCCWAHLPAAKTRPGAIGRPLGAAAAGCRRG